MKPLAVKIEQMVALLRGDVVEVRRPLKRSTEFEGPYNPAYLEAHRNSPGWQSICPHGSRGDRMYVRESLKCIDGVGMVYAADGASVQHIPDDFRGEVRERLGALFMPKWACRMNAEIVSIGITGEPWEWVIRVKGERTT